MRKAANYIVYHQKLGTELSDYGINLPLRDDRSDVVFEALQKKYTFLKAIDLATLPSLHSNDLKLSHASHFVDDWHTDEFFVEEMKKVYESGRPFLAPQKEWRFLRESILRQVSATTLSFERALDQNFCFFLGGGMHHARFSAGNGFCPLNDLVIAARFWQKKGVGKILVLDTDAHFGDGTAEITEKDDSIDTLSIHMAKAWPFDDPRFPMIPSTWDVPIEKGEEAHYLKKLETALQSLSRDYDGAIVVAGADAYEGDQLLSTQDLRLTKDQMLKRDLMVYHFLKEKRIPQLWVMAGGYGPDVPQIYIQFLETLLNEL